MSRLYRPSIPVEVKCRVALRQLGEMWPDKVIEDNRPRARDPLHRSLGALLKWCLGRFADLNCCEVSDLRLDHDPPLGSRMRRTLLDGTTRYSPDANDPEHLFYRPHGPQFAGSHLIKTNVRGDHGQHPDRVLIKRERRRKRKEALASGLRPVSGKLRVGMRVTWPDGRVGKIVHVHKSKVKIARRKTQWPKGRKLRSKSSW